MCVYVVDLVTNFTQLQVCDVARIIPVNKYCSICISLRQTVSILKRWPVNKCYGELGAACLIEGWGVCSQGDHNRQVYVNYSAPMHLSALLDFVVKPVRGDRGSQS